MIRLAYPILIASFCSAMIHSAGGALATTTDDPADRRVVLVMREGESASSRTLVNALVAQFAGLVVDFHPVIVAAFGPTIQQQTVDAERIGANVGAKVVFWLECSDTCQIFFHSKERGGGRTLVRTVEFDDGDLNLDGALEIISGNRNSRNVSILINDKEGGFIDSPTIFDVELAAAVHGYPHDIKVGDFDNDGKPDLATANAGDHTVSLLLSSPINGQADCELPLPDPCHCSRTSFSCHR